MQKLKKVVALVLTVAMLMTTMIVPVYAATDASFKDTDGHWAEAAVERWATAKILEGDTGTDSFRPNDDMTRAELAKVASVLLGLQAKDSYSKSFTDVPANAWYADYVLSCAEIGIIDGMGDGTYRPQANVTREQAFTIISRALQLQGGEADLAAFTDGNKVSDWAVEHVKNLISMKAVEGYKMADGSASLKPQNNITRAEVAKILDYLISVYVAADGSITVSSMLTEGSEEMGNVVVINQIVVSEANDEAVTVKVTEEAGKTVITVVSGSNNVEITTGNTDATPTVVVGNGNPTEVEKGDSILVEPGEDHEGDDYGKCTHVSKVYDCKNCAVAHVAKEVVCLYSWPFQLFALCRQYGADSAQTAHFHA